MLHSGPYKNPFVLFPKQSSKLFTSKQTICDCFLHWCFNHRVIKLHNRLIHSRLFKTLWQSFLSPTCPSTQPVPVQWAATSLIYTNHIRVAELLTNRINGFWFWTGSQTLRRPGGPEVKQALHNREGRAAMLDCFQTNRTRRYWEEKWWNYKENWCRFLNLWLYCSYKATWWPLENPFIYILFTQFTLYLYQT